MRALIVSCLILVPGLGAARHSPASFELDVTDFAVTGTIASVSFRNPHSIRQLLVESDDGISTEWYVEFGSVNLLLRRGWDLESIEAGDTVTCIGNPNQGGAAEMYIWTIRLSDGTEFGR